MYLGGILSLAILAPNLLMFLFPPTSIPESAAAKSSVGRGMAVAERIGQIGTFAMPFFYRLSRPVGTVAMTSLATMVVTVTIYYACWVRYVRRGREYGLLFAPLGPLPLPMALLPMAYFVAMSAFLSSPYLLTAALLFAAGHVYMSKQELARSRATSQP